MAFMEIETTFGVWYIVDVDGESHYVPPGLISLPIEIGQTADEDTHGGKPTDDEGGNEWDDMLRAVRDYVEVDVFRAGRWVEIRAWEGWGARYSAPGYMDATDWVLGDSEEEAEEECRSLYGEEEEGEGAEEEDEETERPVW